MKQFSVEMHSFAVMGLLLWLEKSGGFAVEVTLDFMLLLLIFRWQCSVKKLAKAEPKAKEHDRNMASLLGALRKGEQ